MDPSPGPEHEAFTNWAKSNGIKINGVAPARFPGRRLGMVATRDIDEYETLLSIPVSLMLTIDSIPESFVSIFPKGTSNHAILTAFIIHGDQGSLNGIEAWRAVWPGWDEFEGSMPLFWTGLNGDSEGNDGVSTDATLRSDLLPPSISNHWSTLKGSPVTSNPESKYTYPTRYQNLLPQQSTRLQRHWSAVKAVFPDTRWQTFAHNWAIVNSRSFYYVSPGEDEPEDWNDAIAMVPYADYFNHVDDAECDVVFDGKKYTFTARRQYEKGEEIYMSYGSHSNDFLLMEYGFYLDDNPSDSVYLDEIIFADLAQAEKTELKKQDLLGNYGITASGADDNTIAAASIQHMSRRDWRAYVTGPFDRGFDKEKTADTIRGWIEAYLRECKTKIESLTELLETSAHKEKLSVILARWKQIQNLCESANSAIAISE